ERLFELPSFAVCNNSQSAAVVKGEGWKLHGYFFPEPRRPEAISLDGDIMYQDNTARGHFRKPRLEVVLNGIVGMAAVQVQHINRSISEMSARKGLIKTHL